MVKIYGDMYLDFIFSGVRQLPGIGEEVFSDALDVQLGGGAMAIAILLNRLGVEQQLITSLGKDYISDICRMLLINEGVEPENVFDRDWSPVIVTSVISMAEDRTFICNNPLRGNFKMDNGDLYALLKGTPITYYHSEYKEVYRKLRNEGTQIVYDTGWEYNLDIETVKEDLAFVDVFTPNDKEALKMTGAETVEAALEILSKYVNTVVVKTGDRGCVAVHNKQLFQVGMPCVFHAVDTTGAGDNFMAGMIYGMYHGWPMEKSLKMANVVAGHSTTAHGCYKAGITREKALALLALYNSR